MEPKTMRISHDGSAVFNTSRVQSNSETCFKWTRPTSNSTPKTAIKTKTKNNAVLEKNAFNCKCFVVGTFREACFLIFFIITNLNVSKFKENFPYIKIIMQTSTISYLFCLLFGPLRPRCITDELFYKSILFLNSSIYCPV